ncbi:toxin glutamine deamidase domain-containing protein [Microbispora bryophytorum]|uniref:toxin glutamine deamidase domain-containing protein n=1 Tax=Microbispora bryophytorum TaxID=1460882 RepID=UPI00340B9E8D
MSQERTRRHARWRLPSGVYNPVVSADGRRWRDYEQAAEAPAPSLEDRRLEVRLAALPLGADTVTMPVVPAARNGEIGGRGGHGLGAPAGRRAGSPDVRETGSPDPWEPRSSDSGDDLPAATPTDAGDTGDAGDGRDAGDLRDRRGIGDSEDAEDSKDSEGFEGLADAEDLEGFEDPGETPEAAGEAAAEATAGEATEEPTGGATGETAEETAGEVTAGTAADAALDGSPSPLEGPGFEGLGSEGLGSEETGSGEADAEEPGLGESGSHDWGDFAHVEQCETAGTEPDDVEADVEAGAGAGAEVEAGVEAGAEHADDVEDPAEPGDHLEIAVAGTHDDAEPGEASTAVAFEGDRPGDPPPGAGPDAGAQTGQGLWHAETPGGAVDDGPATGDFADADDFWSAVLHDETERDWLDGPGRPRRLEETRSYGKPGGLAEADPDGQVSLVQAVRGRFPDPRGTWIRLINAEGPTEDAFRSNNAVDCALSVMSTWHGEAVVAARRQPEYDGSGRPLLTGETGGVARAEEWLGHRFEYVGHGRRAYVAIAQRLIFGGHGAAAVLITRWAGGGSHAWNAVNCRGEVLWIDAQRGHMAVEPPYEDVTGVFAVVIDRQGRRL